MRPLVITALVLLIPSRGFADDRSQPLEMLDEANQLMAVGACAGKPAGTMDRRAEIISEHCKKVVAVQEDYRKAWLTPARAFFKANLPQGLPKTVVYPFAGGDLATALTVFPDADDITTLALEPAGDPKSLARLDDAELKRSLGVVEQELAELYKASFSKTMNMINAMRGGKLPTQLMFSLSALHLHGYELVGMRYFRLDPAGNIVYLTAADVARIEKLKDVGARNRGFGDVELRFHKIGSKHEQVYRHLMANLDNVHLAKLGSPLKFLDKKGQVAAMTKAASYLLSYGDFSTFRNYLIRRVEWMVSDTTGIPPSFGEPAGFQYETWGDWKSANMAAGNGSVRWTWKALFASKPHRDLAFRFGYPNGVGTGHMVFMKRGPKPVAKPGRPVGKSPAAKATARANAEARTKAKAKQ